MAKKMTRRKTSDKPKKDTTFTRKDEEFMKMCEWIEVEIFHYNIANKERLHTMACLRLQGLRKGKAIGNNKTEDYGDYSVECVCARYTKPDKPLNARETLKKIYPEVTDEMLPVLEELGL